MFLSRIANFIGFLVIVSAADQQAKIAILTISPAGPAVGFVEGTTFNLTCTSNRIENITWMLPIGEELDHFPTAVFNSSNKIVCLYSFCFFE